MSEPRSLGVSSLEKRHELFDDLRDPWREVPVAVRPVKACCAFHVTDARHRLLANSLVIFFILVNLVLIIVGSFFRGPNWVLVTPW